MAWFTALPRSNSSRDTGFGLRRPDTRTDRRPRDRGSAINGRWIRAGRPRQRSNVRGRRESFQEMGGLDPGSSKAVRHGKRADYCLAGNWALLKWIKRSPRHLGLRHVRRHFAQTQSQVAVTLGPRASWCRGSVERGTGGGRRSNCTELQTLCVSSN